MEHILVKTEIIKVKTGKPVWIGIQRVDVGHTEYVNALEIVALESLEPQGTRIITNAIKDGNSVSYDVMVSPIEFFERIQREIVSYELKNNL